jgi:8-oxo-dGTP pyrophosphatase MutT (NUDIX family)
MGGNVDKDEQELSMAVSSRQVLTGLGADGEFRGRLLLTDRSPRLPESLRYVNGLLILRGYRYPLPARLNRISHLEIENYEHLLPESLEVIDGYLDLRNYNRPLPTGLKILGGAWLGGYVHPLPRDLKIVGSVLPLRGYKHPLPSGLVDVSGDLDLGGYKYPLPSQLKRVGGHLSLRGYRHRLPESLTSVGGALLLDYYPYALPKRFFGVGGLVSLKQYKHALPKSLQNIGAVIYAGNYPHKLPKSAHIGWKNPPGLKEHYDISVPTSESFRRWFSGSKVTLEDGSPRVVYHGTGRGGFTSFDLESVGPKQGGFYFSSDIRQASGYRDSDWLSDFGTAPDPTPSLDGSHPATERGLYRVWLSMKNPLVVDAKGSTGLNMHVPAYPKLRKTFDIARAAKRDGYDGVIFLNINDAWIAADHRELANVYAVFEPTQIKSALFNRGTYDPKDPDIRKNPRKFWGRMGAGALLVAADTGRVLLLRRSSEVNEPLTWGTIGGAIDGREDPETAARREVKEETRYDGPLSMHSAYVFQDGNFKYYNFIGVVPHEFKPVLNWENERAAWVNLQEARKVRGLHFGLRALLDNSIGQISSIVAGDLQQNPRPSRKTSRGARRQTSRRRPNRAT